MLRRRRRWRVRLRRTARLRQANADIVDTLGNVAIGARSVGGRRLSDRAADPCAFRGCAARSIRFLASYYAVPTFVFYPLFIVFFGLGRGAIVAIGFLFGMVAMIVAT